jgi:hypothetical protein
MVQVFKVRRSRGQLSPAQEAPHKWAGWKQRSWQAGLMDCQAERLAISEGGF